MRKPETFKFIGVIEDMVDEISCEETQPLYFFCTIIINGFTLGSKQVLPHSLKSVEDV
jgi:hypothetical protein